MTKITESAIEQFTIELLARLRDTLLPKLMSGEVRLQSSQGEAAI